jgi:hypothetical protein
VEEKIETEDQLNRSLDDVIELLQREIGPVNESLETYRLPTHPTAWISVAGMFGLWVSDRIRWKSCRLCSSPNAVLNRFIEVMVYCAYPPGDGREVMALTTAGVGSSP